MRRTIANAWYWFVRATVKWLFFKGSGGLRVSGKRNVPREGPLIVAPNHVSHLDPPVTACTLPRKLTFMAKEELFNNKLFGGLIGSLGAFPIRRGEGDTEAIRNAMMLLEKGHAVLVFPEGTRGDGAALLPLNRGVAMLAKRTGAKVLPVGIVGTHKKWPKGRSKPKWGRIHVLFGEPFTYEQMATSDSEKVNRETFTAELERRLLNLCREGGYDLRSASSDSSSPEAGHAQSETALPRPDKA
jgi:1-acyl-sn-glycerol-3-phosphate acyltransferase